MEKQTMKYDLLLSQFAGHDFLRKNIASPGKIGEFMYSTDANAAIKIPANKCIKEYSTPDKFPNVEGVFNEALTDSIQKISITELINVLAKLSKNVQRNICFYKRASVF